MDFSMGEVCLPGSFFSEKIFVFLTKTVRNSVQNTANEAERRGTE